MFKPTFKIAFSLFFIIAIHLEAHATELASSQSVSQYLELIGVGPIVNQGVEVWRNQTLKQLNEKLAKALASFRQLSPKQQTFQTQGFKKITEKVNYFYQWNNLKNTTIPIYQKVFTQKEMDDLIAFAKTPTGRNYWRKNREIEFANQSAGEANGIAFVAAINRDLDNLIEELKK